MPPIIDALMAHTHSQIHVYFPMRGSHPDAPMFSPHFVCSSPVGQSPKPVLPTSSVQLCEDSEFPIEAVRWSDCNATSPRRNANRTIRVSFASDQYRKDVLNLKYSYLFLLSRVFSYGNFLERRQHGHLSVQEEDERKNEITWRSSCHILRRKTKWTK